jgi:hypothetical protein
MRIKTVTAVFDSSAVCFQRNRVNSVPQLVTHFSFYYIKNKSSYNGKFIV